ncbi:MAG TPA: hypothetical protein VJP85_10110 [Candidatus Baltobacteraceae bacterium]|nr:hypothetical protein [Candidatus Baltobacteraceae bacterium]
MVRAALAAAASLAAMLYCNTPAQALGVASISLSSGSTPVTWSNVGTSDVHLAPDGNNALTVTGTMQTTALSGSGTIAISAPSSITGTNGAPLAASDISITCSGSTMAGQTYVANKTPLVAGGSVPCATYAAGFVSLSISVTIKFFLDDRTIPADSYLTPSTAFGIVATAS